MRTVFLIACMALLGLMLLGDMVTPGYVLIVIGPYRIESTLFAALLSILTIWVIWRIIRTIVCLPLRWYKQCSWLRRDEAYAGTLLALSLEYALQGRLHKAIATVHKLKRFKGRFGILGISLLGLFHHVNQDKNRAIQWAKDDRMNKVSSLLRAHVLYEHQQYKHAYHILLDDANHRQNPKILEQLLLLAHTLQRHQDAMDWIVMLQPMSKTMSSRLQPAVIWAYGLHLETLSADERYACWQDMPTDCRYHHTCLGLVLPILVARIGMKKTWRILKKTAEKHQDLAVILLMLRLPQQDQDTRDYLNTKHDIYSQDATYWQALGQICHRLGQDQDAKHAYDKASQILANQVNQD